MIMSSRRVNEVYNNNNNNNNPLGLVDEIMPLIWKQNLKEKQINKYY